MGIVLDVLLRPLILKISLMKRRVSWQLVAAAQATRKQTRLDNDTVGISNIATLAAPDILGRSPSPSSSLPVLTIVGGLTHKDALDLNHQRKSKSSPAPTYACQYGANVESTEDKSVSSGLRGSLSSGTEAAVAHDAFEGMIETLSRTKESIGHVTRLTVDCAKYGIAHEVVDLLIRKLES